MSRRFVSSLAISLALMSMTFLCSAQGGNQPQMREKPSAKQLAEAQAKRMEKELLLTEKQYKKVYSLCLEEQNIRENLMSIGTMGGRPDGLGPGGPGMGGPGGQGMRGPGGPGMGRPGMGGPGGQPMGQNGGGRPQMGAHAGGPEMGDIENSLEMQKFQDKKDKKMRKILTQQQYSIWEAQELRRIMEQSPLKD